MDKGNRSNRPESDDCSIVDLRPVRAAYKLGREVAAVEVRTHRVACGGFDAVKLAAAMHAADALARSFAPINAEKSAEWRGIADVYSDTLVVADPQRGVEHVRARELAGCVEPCARCGGEGRLADFSDGGSPPCDACGGVGLAYSPAKLQRLVGKEPRHG